MKANSYLEPEEKIKVNAPFSMVSGDSIVQTFGKVNVGERVYFIGNKMHTTKDLIAICRERTVEDRVSKFSALGVTCDIRPMGSGGVGQVKTTKSEVRFQIGYGTGKHNYAMCAIFEKGQDGVIATK